MLKKPLYDPTFKSIPCQVLNNFLEVQEWSLSPFAHPYKWCGANLDVPFASTPFLYDGAVTH